MIDYLDHSKIEVRLQARQDRQEAGEYQEKLVRFRMKADMVVVGFEYRRNWLDWNEVTWVKDTAALPMFDAGCIDDLSRLADLLIE